MSGMHIFGFRYTRVITLAAVVAVTGCQNMFGNRRGNPPDAFAAGPQVAPEDVSVPPVRPVTYDEREDYRVDSLVEEDDDSFGLGSLSPQNIESTFRQMTGRGPSQQAAKKSYQEGEALFRQAQQADPEARQAIFDAAAEKYQEAAQRWPDSALEEDALMMVGESKFFADRYTNSEASFELLIKKYPNSEHMDTVAARRFTLAKWWLDRHKRNPRFLLQPNFTDRTLPRFDTFGNAVRLFDQIRLDDPTGKLADDATMAAGGAFFEEGKYRRADAFYEDLRKSFPNSPHQFRAHLLGVMCKLKIYQGPDYNGKPLDQAEDLIERIYRQFPDQVAQEGEYLQKAFAETRAKKAERRHYYAKYYERRGEYGGARYYYTRILEEFPNTSLAELAQNRMQEIAERPDRPPQRMEWFVNMFPETQPAQAFLNSGDEHPVTRFLYDPMSIARNTSYSDGTNSHLR
jgi:outer membrane protein assembly factor BamD (BamD/ComL family)